jgi:glucose-6-phosphate 1-dehydrogenase
VIDTLVVLGASGDLTGRLLLPALATLRSAGALGDGFCFVGAGPQDWTSDDFAGHVRRRLSEHAPSVGAADRDAVTAALHYHRADVTEPGDVAAVLDVARIRTGSGAVAVYLALPTRLMLEAVRAVSTYGLPAGSRVAVEKPFGEDAESAAELNGELAGIDESPAQPAIYRVDHALAMDGLRALHDARVPGTSRLIEWSSRQIAQIDLLWEETLALEGRASFYDRAGALRDVMQNHLVQLLCTIAQPRSAAEPADNASVAPERRAEVLRAVRPLSAADVASRTRRARYGAGRLVDSDGTEGRLVPDYTAEDGVDPTRNTETFAEVILELDTPQWADTRIVLRAGKALNARRRGALLHLRAGTETGTSTDGVVWLDLDEPAAAPSVAAEPAAYQRIITDLLNGGTEFAVSAAETELAWRVFTPVLHGWAKGAVPLTTYPAGSTGP